MPSRIIRESCRTSPTLDQLTDGAERMFWRLTTVADDHGRFEADPRVLLANCFPLRVDRFKVGQVQAWFQEQVACGLVSPYTVGGKTYGVFVTWAKHQRIRAKDSKYPAPPLAPPDDGSCEQPPASADSCQQEPADDTPPQSHANPPLPTSDSRCQQTLANAPGGMGYGVGGIKKGGGGMEGARAPGARAPDPPPAPFSSNGFRLDSSIVELIEASPRFSRVTKLRSGEWWRTQVRAFDQIDFFAELQKAEAWLATKGQRRTDLAAFLHNWFKRASEEEA
jgi:hypothetical protein